MLGGGFFIFEYQMGNLLAKPTVSDPAQRTGFFKDQ